MKIYKKRKRCAICRNKKLNKIVEFGNVPLAGYFPKKEEIGTISSYELNLNFCSKCGLVQTDSVIDPNILFKDYRYISSVGLQNHFNEVANVLDSKYGLKNKDVLEIGCNDGVLLEPMKKLGANCVGIDPAENIVKLARDKGLNVINDYFNYKKSKKYKFKNKFNLIVSNNTFAHITNIRSVLKGIEYSLKEGGKFIFEVHYLKRLIEDIQWDNIYHEHIYYYSLITLSNFADLFGMQIVNFEEIPIHSGSIRVTMEKRTLYKYYSIPMQEKIEIKLKEEENMGLYDVNYFKSFNDRMKKQIRDFKVILNSFDSGIRIIGYGASGRANMFCNIVKLTSNDIEFIIDESPERYGRYIANTNIPIYPKEELEKIINKDDVYILILAWNYKDMIIKKLKKIGFNNYIVAFPEPKVI